MGVMSHPQNEIACGLLEPGRWNIPSASDGIRLSRMTSADNFWLSNQAVDNETHRLIFTAGSTAIHESVYSFHYIHSTINNAYCVSGG